MKRRTRLRRQGLPADPPRAPRPVLPAWSEAQSRELYLALVETPLPNSYAANPDVIRDCRRFGIQATLLSLLTLNALPSVVQARSPHLYGVTL